MTVSLRHLRYFVAAADTGQVSRAAVELNVSQSAVTGAIRQIEARIGARLFDRHATGVTLTLEGSRFLQHARNIVASVNEALRIPTSASATIAGQVRIGVTYTVAGYFALQPMMATARAGQGAWSFGALHGMSVGFYALKALLVLVLAWRLGGR